MKLVGKKVTLRAVEQEDLEMLRELTNDPDFERMAVGWSFPISKAQQADWYSAVTKDRSRVCYIIATEEDGAIGMIGIHNIDWKNGTASDLGMRIARKEVRSRGLATDALMTILRFIFNELRLNRVNGIAMAYNDVSLHICDKVGFKVEGRMRQAVFKNGEYHDKIVLGCLRSDYEEKLAETHYWD